MDYKKILKTGKTRAAVLNAFSFLPDSIMLPLQYKIKLVRKLNLKNPQRYTEKLQWYKMHYRNPVMHKCVDKYLVREYVKEKGLEKILVPLIAHYKSIDEVKWDELPNRFVMKTTHGGGVPEGCRTATADREPTRAASRALSAGAPSRWRPQAAR